MTMSMLRNCLVETGIQFLSRVKNCAFDLRFADTCLFDEGLKPNDVVELSAETVFLKKAVLTYLIHKIVLVSSVKGIETDGLNSRVLYVDLSCQFNVNEFVSSIRRYLSTVESLRALTANDTVDLIENTLRNLVIIRCYSNEQLRSTLLSLRRIVSFDPRIKLVVLDGFGCNYWEDVVNGDFKRLDSSSKSGLSLFQNCLKDVKLAGLFVKPKFCVLTNLRGYENVSYKLHARRKDTLLEIIVSTKCSVYSTLFVICGSDVIQLRNIPTI